MKNPHAVFLGRLGGKARMIKISPERRKEIATKASHSRKTPEQRFWKYVEKKGSDECWNWVGSKNKKEYGLLYVQIGVKGKMVLSHRFSYKLHKGKIPEGVLVCHSCDNPACVNPAHLWIGTNRENLQDRNKKGRVASGEKNGRAKLTFEKVAKIREMYAEGEYTHKKLGEIFRVSQASIFYVVHNKKWKK